VDEGHKLTDKKLEKLIRKLDKVYSQAAKETEVKLNDYMRRFKVKDDIKLQQVKSGELDYQEWVDWRIGQIMVGKRWEEMRDTLAEDLTHVDEIATQMVGESMHEVYALNHNFGTFEAEKGSLVDTSYTLYDKHTVENLVKKNPDLLKAPSLDKNKDLRWNKQNFQSAITQSILQGEDIRKTAKRVALGTTKKDRNAAVRNARTATTNAENAGRSDSYKRAKEMGIKMMQVWLATLDGRTRDSHRSLDGEKIPVGDKWHHPKFSNGLRFPGDPQGAAHEVWNCRCTLIAEVEGVDYNLTDISERNNYKLGGQSYDEWQNAHKVKPPVTNVTPPTAPVRGFKAIRGALGDDFVDGMEIILNFTEEEDVRDLFYKYAEDLKVIDTNLRGGAFFRSSDGGIHINASKVSKGDDLHLPYQTIFHEFGHNIDWLANGRNSSNYISNSYYNGKLIDTIKQDWKNFKWEAFVDNKSYDDERYLRTVLRSMDTKKGVLKDLTRQHRNGEITTTEMLSRLTETQRDKLMKEIGFYDSDVVKLLSQEKMDMSTRGNISDIIEGCTHISYPLGVGHGEAYHNSSSTAKEFFAEVIDGKATNPKSLAQMRRVFPNAVKVVEKIIQEVI
jgi:SPP1 gp7 family putative phage head morphogenesis protein